MKYSVRVASVLLTVGAAVLASSPARAGAHTWDVWEVFSNADGTVQFVELHETNGGNLETGITGHMIIATPSARSYTIQKTIPQTTGLKFYLIATPAFAALPGAPVPDEIVPAGTLLFTQATDTSVRYDPYDMASWAVGAVPTDGIHSLQRPGKDLAPVSAVNSPTNYAGGTGSVNASPSAALPGVPDGVVGSPMRADKLAPDGSSISVSWDTAACTGELDHQIIYGQKTDFPAVPGGTYALQGGACNIGTASPFAWTPTPSPTDGNGLIWFLVVTENNASKEGPWGTYNGVNERNGPGTGGASNVCGITSRDTTNACGH